MSLFRDVLRPFVWIPQIFQLVQVDRYRHSFHLMGYKDHNYGFYQSQIT